MTLTRKIAIGVGIVVLGLGGAFGLISCQYGDWIKESLREQGALNDAAKPLLEAVITNRIKVGDTVDHAKQVLAEAGLTAYSDRTAPQLSALYRTGPGCGFTIALDVDRQNRIEKIEIRPFFTGP